MPAAPKPNLSAVRPTAAARTIEAEIEGLRALARALDEGLGEPFAAATDLIGKAAGRVVVTGMGKSGLVARKIAATFASTGTPAFYLHPAEASHGDLGMVTRGDVVLALSKSGETPELRDVINYCKRFAIPLIAISSAPRSALADAADIALLLPKAEEACPNGLAPTTSTTMQMALGDALAIALYESRGFSPAEFHDLHPGGQLGARLVTVGDVMMKGADLPVLSPSADLSEAIIEITRARCGGAAVVDPAGGLVGAFTDGDLRRALAHAGLAATVSAHMSTTPVFVDPRTLVTEAVRLMNDRPRPIMLLFVCENGRLVGAAHMHDLLRAAAA